MDEVCNRCHRSIESGVSFCPNCGLPQLVYNAEAAGNGGEPVRWDEAVRDAGSIAWKSALRAVVTLGLPSGVLCALLWPLGTFGILLMGFTGAWTVSIYMRREHPAWITLGAGARIGLATGIVGAWVAAATTGIALFVMRNWLHLGAAFDDYWSHLVNVQFTEQWNTMGADPQTVVELKTIMLSPNGRAAWVLCIMGFLVTASLLLSIAGGALSARMRIRRRPGN